MGIHKRTKKRLFKGGSGLETQSEYDEMVSQLYRETSSNRREREKKNAREERLLNSKLTKRKEEMRHECSLLVELLDAKVKKGKITKLEAKEYSIFTEPFNLSISSGL